MERELAYKDEELKVVAVDARHHKAQLAQALEEVKSLKEDLNHAHQDIGLPSKGLVLLELKRKIYGPNWIRRFGSSACYEGSITRDWLAKLWTKEMKKLAMTEKRRERIVKQPPDSQNLGGLLSPNSPEEVLGSYSDSI
ncbi:uncharacterized protein A4U43_C05F9280 [Asparagus officinalis]|uniref:Uncharacterized protein n=1 Tax=Asparagus officinalis TaxID=4686 RepID=A0A5P1EU55_ASPOF|nr:uncharacterized protein A4U43_C05F9280 [Asparagus officinalis]